MDLRIVVAVLLLALAAGSPVHAQNRVRTEIIRPPPASVQPTTPSGVPSALAPNPFAGMRFNADGHLPRPERAGTLPAPVELEIGSDPARLPPAVARARARIMAAAQSGTLHELVAAMEENNPPPLFSYAQDKAPIVYWKANYPDSEGVEVLAILLGILELPYAHVDRGTPQEVYLWPYFARLPLKALTPQQKVELFRIVTGNDYKEMLEFGAYSFYRLGIAPDGTWMFFVSGD